MSDWRGPALRLEVDWIVTLREMLEELAEHEPPLVPMHESTAVPGQAHLGTIEDCRHCQRQQGGR